MNIMAKDLSAIRRLSSHSHFMENSINPTDEGLMESLPEEKWRGDELLCQINGFWFMPQFIPGIERVLTQFKPLPTDIILSSFPKTGTTWLKSLLYSIINRSSMHSLVQNNPHELVPFLEMHVYGECKPTGIPTDPNLDSTTRIFSTHIPYQLLGNTLESSGCRVVYVTRNPKDTLVSMWHFVNRWKGVAEKPWLLDEAVERFCDGVFPCGPYYDHVLGYRKANSESPKNVFFITYEELKSDPETHVRRLAEFLGCPFGEDEEEEEEVEEVVKSCSFEVISRHEVNKSEDLPSWFPVPYNSFFRKASVGDHKNYLPPPTIQRIDELTREKFHKSGFIYGI